MPDLLDYLARRGISPAARQIFDDDEAPQRGLIPPARNRGGLLNRPAPPQSARDILDRIFAGSADPRLSAQQQRAVDRDARFNAGLATLLAAQGGSLGESLATGALTGRQSAHQQAQSAFAGQIRTNFMKRIRGDGVSSLEPDELAEFMFEAQAAGDAEMAQFIAPFLNRAIESNQQLREARAAAQGVQLFQEAVGAINSGQMDREQAQTLLERQAQDGSLAAAQALQKLRGDERERFDRRDRIRDDFQDEGEILEVRSRAVRTGLTGDPSDLELIASVIRAETGNPNVSARNVIQFIEQGTLPEPLQNLKDFLTKTSELTDPIRRQMRQRLRFLGGQVARESASFEARLRRAATAEGVLVDDLGVKLPSTLLPEPGETPPPPPTSPDEVPDDDPILLEMLGEEAP